MSKLHMKVCAVWRRLIGIIHMMVQLILLCIVTMSVTNSVSPVAKEVDAAMLTTANFFQGNVFYIVRRAKLAWLAYLSGCVLSQ